MTDFSYSLEQEAIFSHIREARSNLIIPSCPGSGKTFTTLHSFKHVPRRKESLIPPRILYLVFNKRNSEEAKTKVAAMGIRDVEVSTFHSLGMRALKGSGLFSPKAMSSREFVNSHKVPKLVWSKMRREDPDVANVIKLVSLLKSNSGEADALQAKELCAHYEVDLVEEHKSVAIALEVLRQSNEDRTCIDFDDMLYLPVLLNVPFTSADWVFVDECQDTNDVQSEILWLIGKRSGVRLTLGNPTQISNIGNPTSYVFVGDPHQSVYGFRGASTDAMTKLKERFSCDELTLSVSYRCPKAVVQEAQRYV